MQIVTLTSDIGNTDFLVGAIKGRLLQMNQPLSLFDISHDLSPFNYPQAAYVCRNAMKNFPAGSFHLILVNLFDQKPTHLLLAKHNGQYIGCADNGLLTMILEESPQEVVALPLEKSEHKNTLYCISVFADALRRILNNETLNEIGNPEIKIKEKNPLRPLLGNNYIEGHILFIDHFENVIVNIRREEFEAQRAGRHFSIVFKRDEVIDKISETYADVPEGEKLALFNSAGYLEIAINKGNAAGLFGLQGFSEKQQQTVQSHFNQQAFYQTVKVLFE
jgi:S-adenosylmethionine hydrolase